MEIDFQYSLPDPDAKSRLEILGDYLANRHGSTVTSLEADRAKFASKYLVVKIDGELKIGNGRAQFKGEDPGFLWRNRAKDYIQGKLAKYLDPALQPAQLPTS